MPTTKVISKQNKTVKITQIKACVESECDLFIPDFKQKDRLSGMENEHFTSAIKCAYRKIESLLCMMIYFKD